jgi:hypothetical protein
MAIFLTLYFFYFMGQVEDRAFWPTRFRAADASWADLRHLLQKGGGTLFVKERSGLPAVKGFTWTLRQGFLSIESCTAWKNFLR